MSVSNDLQDIVADISVAIAGRRKFGRVELDRLRGRLITAATELRTDARAGTVSRMVLDDLCAGIDKGVADMAGLARHARAQLPEVTHVQG